MAKRILVRLVLALIFVSLLLAGAATAVYGAVTTNPGSALAVDEEKDFDPFDRIGVVRAITPRGVCTAEIDYDTGPTVYLWVTRFGRKPYLLGSSRRMLPMNALTNNNVEPVLKEAVSLCLEALRSKR